MHERYAAGGAPARLVAYGRFGADSHELFGSRAGGRIWQPVVSDFLRSVGLPSEPQPGFERYGPPPAMAVPLPSGFAAIDDLARLPHVRSTGRAGYERFLAATQPRAFAIAPSGSWGWAHGGDDPLQRALDHCNKTAQGQCRLYAVDEAVVWLAQD